MVVGRKPLLPFINSPKSQSLFRIRPRYFLQLWWKRTNRYRHPVQENIRKRAFVQQLLRRKLTIKITLTEAIGHLNEFLCVFLYSCLILCALSHESLQKHFIKGDAKAALPDYRTITVRFMPW